MAAAQLENNFRAMEEDLDRILAVSKQTLQKDKAELRKSKSPRSEAINSRSILKNLKDEPAGQDQEMSLTLGGFEKLTPKQKQLRNERQREYQQYLAEQMSRSGRSTTNDIENTNTRNQVAKPLTKKQEYKKQLDREYEDLVKQKQKEERTYRVQFDTTDGSVSNKGNREEVYVLGSSDYDIIELLKSRKRGKSAELDKRSDQFEDMRADFRDNGRANSVPPNKNMPPIFGGSSNTDLRKQQQQRYKEELEKQIQEKELLKAKDKLKRLGRVTSDVDLTEIEIPKNSKNKWALPIRKPETASIREDKHTDMYPPSKTYQKEPHGGVYAAQNGMYTAQNGATMSQYLPNNQFNQVPNPAAPINPMFAPMQMVNPMMTWQNLMGQYPPPGGGGGGFGYGVSQQPMMMANQHQNMFQQQQQQQQQYPNRKNSGRSSRKHWDVPVLDLDGSINRNPGYVPTAIEQSLSKDQSEKTNIPKRTNIHPPGGGTHGLFNTSPGTDELSARKNKQLEYQKELARQMEIKTERKAKEKAEYDRYESKLEAEIKNYNPWGKEGGGAPVKSKDGHIVANLKNYHQPSEQERTYRDQYQHDDVEVEDSPMMRALAESQNKATFGENFQNNKDLNSSMNGGGKNHSPTTYARGAALKELKGINAKSPRDKVEQDEYKQFLQQQVEEKKRKVEEEKLKAKLEEEKEAKRIEEQQRRIKEEFEREKEKQRKKEEEVRRQNEEMKILAEKKRYEEEAKQKEIKDDYQQELQRQAQLKFQESEKQEHQNIRSSSPPIPTVAKQEKKKQKELQRRVSQQSTDDLTHIRAVVDKASTAARQEQFSWQQQQQQQTSDVQYLKSIRDSMEIQKQINETNVEQQNHLIKQLATLRQQLQHQEKKIKTELQENQVKYKELNPNGKPRPNDIFRKATKKKISNAYIKTDDTQSDASNHEVSADYGKALDSQQRKYMRQQEARLNNLKKKLQPADVLSQRPYLKSRNSGSAKSLLDSESQFISLRNHDDITDQIKATTSDGTGASNDRNTRYNSARTRRRQKEKEKENDAIFQEYFPSKQRDADTTSITTYHIEEMSRKNEERLKQFSDTRDEDPDDIVQNFMRNAKASVEEPRADEDSLYSDSQFYNT